MASKKGKTVTVIILVAITAASFIFWAIPQENEASFSVSNHENYLNGVTNIHEILEEGIEEEFQKLKSGEISSEEYISSAEITTAQVTEQISELVKSKPSEEWQESYINYMDSLRQFNSQIRETIVYANLIDEENESKLTQSLESIESLKEQSKEFAEKSMQTRP